MSRPLNKSIWKGRDNNFVLRLESVRLDGQGLQVVTPTDLAPVSSMLLELEGDVADITVDANDADAPINWWDGALEEGEVKFMLGHVVDAVGVGAYSARLTLFSDATPNGVVWVSYSSVGGLSLSVHDTVTT